MTVNNRIFKIRQHPILPQNIENIVSNDQKKSIIGIPLHCHFTSQTDIAMQPRTHYLRHVIFGTLFGTHHP